MKKTVLIIGVSSFVGSNLALALKDHFRVVGTYFKTPIEISGVTTYPCDVLKKDYLNALIGQIKPDFTVYAVGMSSLTECKLFPKHADSINAVGAVNACISSERYGAKFIYLSSCFVLGGENQVYKEKDTPFPNTVYGINLSSTEFYVQRSCLNYLVLRCSPLYGRSYGPKHPNWFEIVQSSLVQNQPVYADDTVTTGFLDIYVLARVLKALLESSVTNRLFQISSSNSLTRYGFSKLIAKTFKKDENLIQRGSSPFPVEASTARLGSKASSAQYFFLMDNSNTEEFLGLKMPTIEESLLLTKKRLSDRV